MPIPGNKSELIEAIESTYGKLKKDLKDINPTLSEIPQMEGHARGTIISVNNLLAYLIGWGELVLFWNDQHQKGSTIHFPAADFKWTELGLLAQQFYKDYEHLGFAALTERLDKTVDMLLEMVQSHSEAYLYDEPFYKHYPFGRMVQLNSSSPYKNARKRLRIWKRSLNT